MAHHKRPITPKQAWRMFEEAVSKTNDIQEAAEWLRKHPQVAKKMTGAGLLECFDEDMKK
jgi:pterin-4a-carbinolamine dehydratase